MYSLKVIEHFRKPKNVGKINDADGFGTFSSSESNDVFNISLNIKDDKIIDIKFQTFGCAAAIASSSVLTKLAKGKPLDEAFKLNRNDIVEELGGLPPSKMECSTHVVEALHHAINNYYDKKNRREP